MWLRLSVSHMVKVICVTCGFVMIERKDGPQSQIVEVWNSCKSSIALLMDAQINGS